MRPKAKRGNWIAVVAGIMIKQGQVLIGQRPETNSLPGQWEFPGGKIEHGESPEQALARELKEELGIDAEVGQLKLALTHSYGDTSIVILFYEIPFWKGEPKPKHHLQIDWVYPQEIKDRTIPEANRKVLDRLLSIMTKPK